MFLIKVDVEGMELSVLRGARALLDRCRPVLYVENADALKAKGVDEIICLSVNDAFVMGAWGEDRGTGDKVRMIADGNGDLTKALGLEMDGSGIGFGLRCQRFAAIIDDGTVTKLAVEAPGKFEVSAADAILAAL